MSCKYVNCKRKHSAKGFCKKHYHDFYKGRIDFSGNHLNGYVPKTPATYCKYPECFSRGSAKNSLRHGLCNKHRKWADKGIIDRVSLQVLKPERIPVKHPLDIVYVNNLTYVFKKKCRIKGCLKESRRNHLCQGHSSSFKAGKIDYDGNPLYERRYYNYSTDKCKIQGCCKKIKRLVKGFCLYHYEIHRKKSAQGSSARI